MVINWNPRKAICFWRALGRWQEHRFPDFILWQITAPQGHPRQPPDGVAEAPLSDILWSLFLWKVIPVQTSLLRTGLSHLFCSPFWLIQSGCVTGQELSPGWGPALGRLPRSGGAQSSIIRASQASQHGCLSNKAGLPLLAPESQSLITLPPTLCSVSLLETCSA